MIFITLPNRAEVQNFTQPLRGPFSYKSYPKTFVKSRWFDARGRKLYLHLKYIGNIGLILRYFLNDFPFEIRYVCKVNHIQAKHYSNFRKMALVRRRGGNKAAVRTAWEIEFSAMSSANMSFT